VADARDQGQRHGMGDVIGADRDPASEANLYVISKL
jgi:hypothetical protein